jgi:hypothetical protein
MPPTLKGRGYIGGKVVAILWQARGYISGKAGVQSPFAKGRG